MFDLHNANELRAWAAQCADKAQRSSAEQAEHERLLTMRDSLLALADNLDWLEGRMSGEPRQSAAA